MTEQKHTQQLPEWHVCEEKAVAGEASALERFIYDNEPAGNAEAIKFRDGLAAMLAEVGNAVPRDVLMAFGATVRDACSFAVSGDIGVRSADNVMAGVDITALADRYASQVQPEPGSRKRVRIQSESLLAAVSRARASHQKFVDETGIDYAALVASGFDANSGVQVQPEPVNQQTLAARPKRLSYSEGTQEFVDGWNAAIAAAEAAQPMKHDAVTLLREIEWENNKWAECCPVCGDHKKDGHAVGCKLAAALSCQQPASAQPVAVPDERAAFEAWLQENIDDTDTVRPSKEKVDAYFAVWLARAQLSAAQKPEGGE